MFTRSVGAVIGAAVVSVATVGSASAVTLNNQFFDWTIGASPAPANFVSSPFLTDANAPSVSSFLASLPPGSIHAVKVERPINDATAQTVFSNPNYKIDFVFGDLETADPVGDTGHLVNQVRSSTSSDAYVGTFGLVSIAGHDPTLPDGYWKNGRGSHSFAGFQRSDFNKANVNMSNADLYPGDPSYRNPASGDSNAPNIRSALFTLPVWRVAQVTQTKTEGELNIPYATDFNNWGNPAFDSDHNPSNEFRWENPTHDQMLSSQDTAAQMAHYRLRGADSVHLMITGVVGKSETELQNELLARHTSLAD